MTAALTYDGIVANLVRQGVPRAKAEAAAATELAIAQALPEQRETAQELPDVLWPVRFTIPWSVLVSDNDKFLASMRGPKPAMVIRQEYAKAKQKIAQLARRATGDAKAVAIPLEFIGRVFMPSERRADPTNFAKLVQDALEGVVYQRDAWLSRVTWENAGKCVDAPRAEITITPITQEQ